MKLDFRHNRGYGHVLTVGQGDTGQLGLGEDIMEKSRPGLITTLSDAVDIVAGNIFQRECPVITLNPLRILFCISFASFLLALSLKLSLFQLLRKR